jgi:hypothetical protein
MAALLLAGIANATVSINVTAFQNGNTIKLVYFENFTCAPAPSTVYLNNSESVNATAVTACEFGSSVGVNTTGSIPRWDLIPAFAGMSVYGYNAYGASPQGYPVYNGMVLRTECAAGQTTKACIHRPIYIYSPILSAGERLMNVSNGMNGLPEGVLPNAARDLLVSQNANGTIQRAYEVRVWVFDPNIFPNLTTGKCIQVANSSLADPTADCLTSLASLRTALATVDTDISAINSNNILWKVAGGPDTQAVILTAIPVSSNPTNSTQFVVQQSSNISIANTNQFIWSYIGKAIPANQTAPTIIAQIWGYPGASTLIPAAVLIAAVLVLWYLARGRLFGVERPQTRQKAQGAMEYLMTYGWAILIIAIVIGALFKMGVFNTSFAANGCVAVSGYLCAANSLTQLDNLSFTVGQLALTKTIYNVAAACSSAMTGSGLPNPSPVSGAPYAAMVYISSTGAATNVVANGVTVAASPLSLSPGQRTVVTGLTCYGGSGTLITPVVGSAFNGYIWLDYTTGSGVPTAPGGANPLNNVKIATMSVKVSS